ncbi:TolC family protein [Methylophaga sp. OBS4]|uniref:TolC family protein n=1 Tax=Methylophaga sp. OBS4 TaxID=2991935 RepID=UPI00225A5891|nr:TolC family protein [Methylophaga sp. OBS4]MCX4186840.1 TolC family protein [Methylophaga sp. OBS4]
MSLNTCLASCLLAAGLLLPGLAGAEQMQAEYSAELTLSELAERVYQRLPGKLGENKYSGQRQANDSVAGAMFADPATANLSHFNDAVGSSDGFQEWEGSVDLPLWLPGQKQQQQGLSEKIAAQLPAYQQQLKLQASGEVRALIWQIKLAEADLQQATLAWKTAQKLEQDVITRVKAGDLPATERLLANSNTIEAHSKMVDADSRLQQTMKTYIFITGEQVLPEQHRETLHNEQQISSSHPQLLLQDLVIQRLQAQMGLAQYDKAVNPNLSLGLRRERGDFDESFNNSIGVGVSFALGDTRYSQPAVAEAAAELADAQIIRQQALRELNSRLLIKQEQLAGKQKQLVLISEQDKITQQYYQLQKRAFDLGEINLIDLLRSQTLANESQSRKRTLEVEIQQKIAEVNQALGISL